MSVGYNFNRFVDLSETDEQDFTCNICHEVLNSPCVTPCCQQMFCKVCIEEWLKTSRTCPFDRKTLHTIDLCPPPRMVINKLGELKIKCEYENRGCTQVVSLQCLQKHLKECHFKDICDKCSNKTPEVIEQLIQKNKELEKKIRCLETERDNLLQTIQNLTRDLDAVDPILGPSDKRVFKAWRQITFGLEINEYQIILNARKYLGQNEPIVTESQINEEMRQTIVAFVSKQLFEEKSVFNICKNLVKMLDMEYGNSWQCMADYEDSSMAYFTYETGYLLKLRFELLQFKIFRAFNSDEHNFLNRFRQMETKHDIEVKGDRSNMTQKMVSFIKRLTFEAIEKFDSLTEILTFVQDKLGREYGGHWYCLAYSMGAFPLRRIKRHFIEFQLLDIKFTVFQSDD